MWNTCRVRPMPYREQIIMTQRHMIVISLLQNLRNEMAEDETLEILKQAQGSIWQRSVIINTISRYNSQMAVCRFLLCAYHPAAANSSCEAHPPTFTLMTSYLWTIFLTERVLVIDGYSHLLHTYSGVLLPLPYILYTDNCRSTHPTVTQWNLQMTWSSCLCSQDCCCTTALLFLSLWTGVTPPVWTSVWAKAKWSKLAAAVTTDPWKPSLLRSINTQLLFLTTSWDLRPTQRRSSRDASGGCICKGGSTLQGNPHDSPLLVTDVMTFETCWFESISLHRKNYWTSP